ncbi:unnamed protein product [Amoebophrya sp. A25]|nr:unnamed protein product [Amoebophrya sp. A25]|eukprot:GSA25T00017878001.1
MWGSYGTSSSSSSSSGLSGSTTTRKHSSVITKEKFKALFAIFQTSRDVPPPVKKEVAKILAQLDLVSPQGFRAHVDAVGADGTAWLQEKQQELLAATWKNGGGGQSAGGKNGGVAVNAHMGMGSTLADLAGAILEKSPHGNREQMLEGLLKAARGSLTPSPQNAGPGFNSSVGHAAMGHQAVGMGHTSFGGSSSSTSFFPGGSSCQGKQMSLQPSGKQFYGGGNVQVHSSPKGPLLMMNAPAVPAISTGPLITAPPGVNYPNHHHGGAALQFGAKPGITILQQQVSQASVVQPPTLFGGASIQPTGVGSVIGPPPKGSPHFQHHLPTTGGANNYPVTASLPVVHPEQHQHQRQHDPHPLNALGIVPIIEDGPPADIVHETKLFLTSIKFDVYREPDKVREVVKQMVFERRMQPGSIQAVQAYLQTQPLANTSDTSTRDLMSQLFGTGGNSGMTMTTAGGNSSMSSMLTGGSGSASSTSSLSGMNAASSSATSSSSTTTSTEELLASLFATTPSTSHNYNTTPATATSSKSFTESGVTTAASSPDDLFGSGNDIFGGLDMSWLNDTSTSAAKENRKSASAAKAEIDHLHLMLQKQAADAETKQRKAAVEAAKNAAAAEAAARSAAIAAERRAAVNGAGMAGCPEGLDDNSPTRFRTGGSNTTSKNQNSSTSIEIKLLPDQGSAAPAASSTTSGANSNTAAPTGIAADDEKSTMASPVQEMMTTVLRNAVASNNTLSAAATPEAALAKAASTSKATVSPALLMSRNLSGTEHQVVTSDGAPTTGTVLGAASSSSKEQDAVGPLLASASCNMLAPTQKTGLQLSTLGELVQQVGSSASASSLSSSIMIQAQRQQAQQVKNLGLGELQPPGEQSEVARQMREDEEQKRQLRDHFTESARSKVIDEGLQSTLSAAGATDIQSSAGVSTCRGRGKKHHHTSGGNSKKNKASSSSRRTGGSIREEDHQGAEDNEGVGSRAGSKSKNNSRSSKDKKNDNASSVAGGAASKTGSSKEHKRGRSRKRSKKSSRNNDHSQSDRSSNGSGSRHSSDSSSSNHSRPSRSGGSSRSRSGSDASRSSSGGRRQQSSRAGGRSGVSSNVKSGTHASSKVSRSNSKHTGTSRRTRRSSKEMSRKERSKKSKSKKSGRRRKNGSRSSSDGGSSNSSGSGSSRRSSSDEDKDKSSSSSSGSEVDDSSSSDDDRGRGSTSGGQKSSKEDEKRRAKKQKKQIQKEVRRARKEELKKIAAMASQYQKQIPDKFTYTGSHYDLHAAQGTPSAVKGSKGSGKSSNKGASGRSKGRKSESKGDGTPASSAAGGSSGDQEGEKHSENAAGTAGDGGAGVAPNAGNNKRKNKKSKKQQPQHQDAAWAAYYAQWGDAYAGGMAVDESTGYYWDPNTQMYMAWDPYSYQWVYVPTAATAGAAGAHAHPSQGGGVGDSSSTSRQLHAGVGQAGTTTRPGLAPGPNTKKPPRESTKMKFLEAALAKHDKETQEKKNAALEKKDDKDKNANHGSGSENEPRALNGSGDERVTTGATGASDGPHSSPSIGPWGARSNLAASLQTDGNPYGNNNSASSSSIFPLPLGLPGSSIAEQRDIPGTLREHLFCRTPFTCSPAAERQKMWDLCYSMAVKGPTEYPLKDGNAFSELRFLCPAVFAALEQAWMVDRKVEFNSKNILKGDAVELDHAPGTDSQGDHRDRLPTRNASRFAAPTATANSPSSSPRSSHSGKSLILKDGKGHRAVARQVLTLVQGMIFGQEPRNCPKNVPANAVKDKCVRELYHLYDRRTGDLPTKYERKQVATQLPWFFLHTLDLSNNEIDTETATRWLDFLRVWRIHVKNISFADNPMIDHRIFGPLMHYVGGCASAIRVIDLRGTNVFALVREASSRALDECCDCFFEMLHMLYLHGAYPQKLSSYLTDGGERMVACLPIRLMLPKPAEMEQVTKRWEQFLKSRPYLNPERMKIGERGCAVRSEPRRSPSSSPGSSPEESPVKIGDGGYISRPAPSNTYFSSTSSSLALPGGSRATPKNGISSSTSSWPAWFPALVVDFALDVALEHDMNTEFAKVCDNLVNDKRHASRKKRGALAGLVGLDLIDVDGDHGHGSSESATPGGKSLLENNDGGDGDRGKRLSRSFVYSTPRHRSASPSSSPASLRPHGSPNHAVASPSPQNGELSPEDVAAFFGLPEGYLCEDQDASADEEDEKHLARVLQLARHDPTSSYIADHSDRFCPVLPLVPEESPTLMSSEDGGPAAKKARKMSPSGDNHSGHKTVSTVGVEKKNGDSNKNAASSSTKDNSAAASACAKNDEKQNQNTTVDAGTPGSSTNNKNGNKTKKAKAKSKNKNSATRTRQEILMQACEEAGSAVSSSGAVLGSRNNTTTRGAPRNKKGRGKNAPGRKGGPGGPLRGAMKGDRKARGQRGRDRSRTPREAGGERSRSGNLGRDSSSSRSRSRGSSSDASRRRSPRNRRRGGRSRSRSRRRRRSVDSRSRSRSSSASGGRSRSRSSRHSRHSSSDSERSRRGSVEKAPRRGRRRDDSRENKKQVQNRNNSADSHLSTGGAENEAQVASSSGKVLEQAMTFCGEDPPAPVQQGVQLQFVQDKDVKNKEKAAAASGQEQEDLVAGVDSNLVVSPEQEQARLAAEVQQHDQETEKDQEPKEATRTKRISVGDNPFDSDEDIAQHVGREGVELDLQDDDPKAVHVQLDEDEINQEFERHVQNMQTSDSTSMIQDQELQDADVVEHEEQMRVQPHEDHVTNTTSMNSSNSLSTSALDAGVACGLPPGHEQDEWQEDEEDDEEDDDDQEGDEEDGDINAAEDLLDFL